MFKMASVLVLTAAVVACPGPGSSAEVKAPDAAEFVRAAVYDGLTADGVSPDLARELAANPDFIKGCKLCELTHAALEQYGKLAKAPAAKPGRGLAPETVQKLRSKDRDARLAALRDLVGRYTGYAYDKRGLPATQRAALEGQVKGLALQLKNPADGLPGGMPFCPSCDGACRKPPAVISQ